MEAAFNDELLLLEGALRSGGFRFILISHNHPSVYKDIKNWITDHWAATRKIEEFLFEGKNAGEIKDSITQFQSGILLLRDTDVLFRDSYTELCTYFNQRRDFFAKYDIAYIAFIQPSSFPKVAHHLPDWWSLRSLELEFVRENVENVGLTEINDNQSIVYSNHSLQEKEDAIQRLEYQLSKVSEDNFGLKIDLHNQVGKLYFSLSKYKEAEDHWTKFLILSQKNKNYQSEGVALNNISQIYEVKNDYNSSLNYLLQSLDIIRKIGDQQNEAIVLNNIGKLYNIKGDYDTALQYLEQSLVIRRLIKDHIGEGTSLSNLAGIARSKGDLDSALRYLTDSLAIRRQIGDLTGEGTSLNNIGFIYGLKGEYDQALSYLMASLTIVQQIGNKEGEGRTLHNIGAIHWETKQDAVRAIPLLLQSLHISQQIGIPNAVTTEKYLAKIKAEIGEDHYREIAGE